jgi:hypothetical protein
MRRRELMLLLAGAITAARGLSAQHVQRATLIRVGNASTGTRHWT